MVIPSTVTPVRGHEENGKNMTSHALEEREWYSRHMIKAGLQFQYVGSL